MDIVYDNSNEKENSEADFRDVINFRLIFQ